MQELEKAKNYALKLLTFRARSEYEFKTKLKGKGYSEDIVEKTLQFLKEYEFINDRKFSEMWLDNRVNLKPLGRWRLKQELKQKGIAEGIIEQVLEKVNPEMELSQARQLILKKTAKGPIKRQKLEQFLARRGFLGEIIRKAIKETPSERIDKG